MQSCHLMDYDVRVLFSLGLYTTLSRGTCLDVFGSTMRSRITTATMRATTWGNGKMHRPGPATERLIGGERTMLLWPIEVRTVRVGNIRSSITGNRGPSSEIGRSGVNR